MSTAVKLIVIQRPVPIDTLPDGVLDPVDCALGVSVPDEGPELIIVFIQDGNPIKCTEALPQCEHGCAEGLENQRDERVVGEKGKLMLKFKRSL